MEVMQVYYEGSRRHAYMVQMNDQIFTFSWYGKTLPVRLTLANSLYLYVLYQSVDKSF